MRTIWHSLAWKEWHEHKWMLAAATAIFAGVSAIGAISNIRHGDLEFDPFAPLIALLYSSVPLSLFIAATAASGERSKNTLAFYQSLPVPMWKAGSWKLFYGLMTCLVAILTTIAVYNLWYLYFVFIGRDVPIATLNALKHAPPLFSDRPLLNWNLYIAFATCFVASSVFIWVAAVGVNRRTEVAAGGLAMLAIIFWWTAIVVGAHWFFPNSPPAPFWPAGAILAASPGGLPLLIATELMPNEVGFIVPILIALIIHGGLAAWFALRFGRTEIGIRWSPKADLLSKSGPVLLRPPRRSRLSAIIWKQTRELTPIVVAGVIGIFSVVLVQFAIHPDFYSRVVQLSDLLIGVTTFVGMLVALAAGIAIFDRDLGPRLNTFWRSRPIKPDLWFWAKSISGLASISLVFIIPPLAAILWSVPVTAAGRFSETFVFFFHLAIYTAAMAAICLIRQNIYAAILGVGLVTLIVVIPMIWIDPQRVRLQSVIVALSTITTVACTLVAWLAVRYDWGRKN
jgi:hypothetical protein